MSRQGSIEKIVQVNKLMNNTTSNVFGAIPNNSYININNNNNNNSLLTNTINTMDLIYNYNPNYSSNFN